MRFRRQRSRSRQPDLVLFENLGVVPLYHAGAGTGWRDNVVECFECGNYVARDRSRAPVHAGIPRRLSATSLRLRYLDMAAGLLEQLDGGESHLRTHKIDKACNEKADTRACAH
jgi:hypothetical protein